MSGILYKNRYVSAGTPIKETPCACCEKEQFEDGNLEVYPSDIPLTNNLQDTSTTTDVSDIVDSDFTKTELNPETEV